MTSPRQPPPAAVVHLRVAAYAASAMAFAVLVAGTAFAGNWLRGYTFVVGAWALMLITGLLLLVGLFAPKLHSTWQERRRSEAHQPF